MTTTITKPKKRRVFGRLRAVIGEGDDAKVFCFELTRAGLNVRRFHCRRNGAHSKLIPFSKLAEACASGQTEFKL